MGGCIKPATLQDSRVGVFSLSRDANFDLDDGPEGELSIALFSRDVTEWLPR